MSVVALCNEVRRRLGADEDWPLEAMPEHLTKDMQRRGSTVPILELLSLAVAAILELSRELNSIGSPTSGSTCASGEPSVVRGGPLIGADIAALLAAWDAFPDWRVITAEEFHALSSAVEVLRAKRAQVEGMERKWRPIPPRR